jgi:hypothetical protein
MMAGMSGSVGKRDRFLLFTSDGQFPRVIKKPKNKVGDQEFSATHLDGWPRMCRERAVQGRPCPDSSTRPAGKSAVSHLFHIMKAIQA